MKKAENTEKRCITCGRIIVDENNKTGVCPKCTKRGLTVGAAAAAVVPVAAVGIKKYGKSIVKGITTVAKIFLKR
ncbi:MAG: hypothetical protein J6B01_03315 [Ruminococcus sp.]|nr:hypothetical protein [Ruminococcus sp.]